MALKLVSHEYCPCRDEKVAQYILDSASDAANLPDSCTGSTAMVAASGGEMYMVNASGEWKELASGGGGGGGSGGGGGKQFEVYAVTVTTDGEEYGLYGVFTDENGNAVSHYEIAEDGKTYYIPVYAALVVESHMEDMMGMGVTCSVETDDNSSTIQNIIVSDYGNVYAFNVGESGTISLKSESGWG